MMRKRKIKTFFVRPAERAAIVEMRRRGVKLYTIAHEFGRCINTISRISIEERIPAMTTRMIRQRKPSRHDNMRGVLSLPG